LGLLLALTELLVMLASQLWRWSMFPFMPVVSGVVSLNSTA